MKTSLHSVLFILCFIPFFSQAQGTANLVLFSENGEKFSVSIDGEAKNDIAQSNVRVEGLKGDFHKILVQFEDKDLGSVSQNFILEPGTEQKAQIMMKKNGKWAIRPFGEAQPLASVEKEAPKPAPAPVVYDKPAAVAPAESEVSTTTTTTTTGSAGEPGESIDVKIGMGDQSAGISVRINDGGMTQTTTTTSVTQTSTHSTSMTEPAEEATEEIIVDDCAPMTESGFNSAMNSLKSKTFSDSRMTQAKQILKSNCMSAEQVKSAMKAFEYEDDKLEFAKMAYDRCSDQENFWKVNDAFEFEMTIDELNEYIESK
ncbi:MAG TPA: DUF4476 domain-containing protein [Cryomorphaceae bacterium]|nr:DUF4476 domain-containing protein [Cryomorphaceae bacterium]HKL40118.1 DUF4476 domain-containing protein [Cryomorphaceae bacterium]